MSEEKKTDEAVTTSRPTLREAAVIALKDQPCVEQVHLALTENIVFVLPMKGGTWEIYACGRCGVLFAPEAILR